MLERRGGTFELTFQRLRSKQRALQPVCERNIRKISFELCGCWTKEERTHSEGSYKNGESFRDSSVSLKGGGRRRDGQIERFWQVQKRESFLTSAA